jgi:hypothetical protein
VIEKRRELQRTKTHKVSLVEALIHTIFDTTDKLSLEWNNVNRIVDQRRQESGNMLQWNEPKKPLMLTYQPSTNAPQMRQLQFTPTTRGIPLDLEDNALRMSIPDNRIQK